MKWIKSKWFSGITFSALFIGLCWYFNYQVTFPQPPQSVHVWRQTNSLSITQMYYQYNVNFFKPEIQNQLGDGGLSGKTAGEFPIIYYTVAKIWQVFGKAEWSFRLFQLLILFAGIFLLFRMMTDIIGNAVMAGFISMLVFTSPMFIFYGPNFLPDAPALAFTFMAWYFLYQFTQKRKNSSLWFSAIFIFLATSLKITTATSFIAIGAWILFETFFVKPDKRVFNFSFKHYIPFIICILPIIAWYIYIDYYNEIHHADYMFRGIWPIWKMTTEQFNRIMDSLNKIYFKEFFFPPLQYITILVWIFMLFNIKKIAPFYGYLLIVLPLGFAAILVLWFQVLEGHDYYMITQMQVLVIVWAVFFSYLKNKKPFNHPATYILLLAAFVLLANNGRKRQNERFQGWMNENYFLHFEALTEIEPCFEKWNIKPDDKVISLPDFAINTSLYYMNRKGYTEFGSDYLSEETIKKRIYQGAKYLVLNDTSILRQPAIQKFATNFVGQYRNVRVYKINPGLVDSIQSASSNSGSRPQDIYHVSKNEIVIINNLEETLSKNSSWKGEITVFNKKKMAHSGNYVCITNDTLEYSYTYNELFKNINDRVPKSVIFRGWIYTTLANPKISIICGLNNNGKQYYWNAYPLEQVLTETGKWVEFTSSFYFDNKTIDLNDDIALYAWNQSKKPIYIDDLKISFIY